MHPAASSFYLAVFSLLAPRNAHAFCVAASPATASTAADPNVCAIDSKSIVSDACASFSTLDTLNADLQPAIKSLTQTSDFFSYYRLNLYNKECPFWSDNAGSCGNIACVVNTIENEEDIPLIWRAEELGKLEGRKAEHPDRKIQREQPSKPLMGKLGEDVGESCVVEYDDECDDRDYCVPEDERATAKGDYVSLVDNPERFTGYSGPSANQVWEAIYRENCFSKSQDISNSLSNQNPFQNFGKPQAKAARDLRSVMAQGSEMSIEFDDECLEKRVFHRIISGMHASISTHICYDYLNQTTGQWGPNLQCYEERLHDYPERISNLYFNYALVLRAVAKVRNVLAKYTFCSGDPTQDMLTKRVVLDLADRIAAGPNIYDESLMFQDGSTVGLKEDFRNRFRNVSRTMDCVGCDKCRLWGKVQVAGYGTALKILFEFDEKNVANNPPLRRTELVALVNTLGRLSSSLTSLSAFRNMDHRHLNEPFIPREALEPAVSAPEMSIKDEEARLVAEGQDPSLGDAFNSELEVIWHATKWVVRSWMSLPSALFKILSLTAKILAVQMHGMWNYFLGKPHSRPPKLWYTARDEI